MSEKLVNKGWSKMEVLLDEHLPARRKRRAAPIYWLAGASAVVLILMGVIFANYTIESGTGPEPENKIADKPVSENSNQSYTHTSNTIVQTSDNQKGKLNSPSKESNGHSSGISNEKESTRDNSTVQNNVNRNINGTALAQINSAPNSGQASQTEAANSNSEKEASSATIFHESAPTSESTQLTQVKSSGLDVPTFTQAQSSRVNSLGFIEARVKYLAQNELPTVRALQLSTDHGAPVKIGRLEAYVQAFGAQNIWSLGGGLAMNHNLSSNLQLVTGLEFARHNYDFSNGESGQASTPSTDIFTNAQNYSGYLAENSIEAARFLSASSTIYATLKLRYSIGNRFSVYTGIAPGVQIHRNISYDPIATPNLREARNPQIGNEGMTAEDFFEQKSVAVLDGQIGIQYNLLGSLFVHLEYRKAFSDYARGLRYAGSDKLENLSAGTIDRNFYSIERKSVKPGMVGAGLSLRF